MSWRCRLPIWRSSHQDRRINRPSCRFLQKDRLLGTEIALHVGAVVLTVLYRCERRFVAMFGRMTREKHIFRQVARKISRLRNDQGIEAREKQAECLPIAASASTDPSPGPENALTDPRAPTLLPLPPKPINALDLVGQVLVGRYHVIEALGAGGMGTVFRAWDEELGVHVALKILPEPAARDKAAVARFRREASLVRGIQHEGVCRAYDYCGDGPVPFFTMELVKGRRLRDVINDKKLPVHKVYKLLLQVASALEAVHANRIVHRDLKPENILVRRSRGKAVLVDFGLAKQSRTRGMSTTDAFGTVRYMSPEQLNGGRLDARTDLFSFGVMAFELLSGKPPFGAGPDAQVMTAILRDEPAQFECLDLAPEVVRDFRLFFQRVLAKAPESRFPSAREMSIAFKNAWVARFVDNAPNDKPPVKHKGDNVSLLSPAGKAWFQVALFAGIVKLIIKLNTDDNRNESAYKNIILPADDSSASVQVYDPAKPAVVVLAFRNLSDDTDLDWLIKHLTAALHRGLMQTPTLNILDTIPATTPRNPLIENGGFRSEPSNITTNSSPFADFGTCPRIWLIGGTVRRTNELMEVQIDVRDWNNVQLLPPIELNGNSKDIAKLINAEVDHLLNYLDDRARMAPEAG